MAVLPMTDAIQARVVAVALGRRTAMTAVATATVTSAGSDRCVVRMAPRIVPRATSRVPSSKRCRLSVASARLAGPKPTLIISIGTASRAAAPVIISTRRLAMPRHPSVARTMAA